MDNKRIALASIFIFATIGIGFALYFFFFRHPPSPAIVTPTGTNKASQQFPESATGGPSVTSSTPAQAVLPSSLPTTAGTAQGGITSTQVLTTTATSGVIAAKDSTGAKYYDSSAGTFYSIDASGNKIALTNDHFFDVQSVAWSPNQDKAVMEFPDGFNVIYDFKSKKQTTLPTHWSNFEFSKSGDQIAAISKGIADSQNFLITMNNDGTNAQAIEPLGANANKVIVSWNPGGNVVAFSKTGDAVGGEQNSIYMIGQHGENYKALVVDGLGFEPQWFPDGGQLLYSTHSSRTNFRPELWVVDAHGGEVGSNRRELQVNTWADKCVAQNSSAIVCAVPNSLPDGAGFAPDVAKDTPDTFYVIDSHSGLKTQLAIPEIPVNAKDLSISSDGQYLFYRNTFTNNLEKLKLK